MFRFLMCCAVVAILLSPAVVQAEKPEKTTIAHIGDVVVTEEPLFDDSEVPVEIGIRYTITGYYNVITVSEKALTAHGGHAIEVMGEVFEDIIPYEGTEGKHFPDIRTKDVEDE